MKLFYLFFILVLAQPALSAKRQSKFEKMFEKEKSCVVYEATKSVLLIGKGKIFGRNCYVNIAIKPIENKVNFSITLSPSNFDSNNEERDAEVNGILTDENNKEITAEATLNQALLDSENVFNANGTLKIKGITTPVTMSIERNLLAKRPFYAVKIDTSFSELNLEAPSIGPGGAVADVKDHLILHARILVKDVEKHREKQRDK